MENQNNTTEEKLLPPGIPALISPEKSTVPQTPPLPPTPSLPGVPSPKAQSWGALISIVVIVLMVIIGAFYAWGKRISETGIPASALVAE